MEATGESCKQLLVVGQTRKRKKNKIPFWRGRKKKSPPKLKVPEKEREKKGGKKGECGVISQAAIGGGWLVCVPPAPA